MDYNVVVTFLWSVTIQPFGEIAALILGLFLVIIPIFFIVKWLERRSSS